MEPDIRRTVSVAWSTRRNATEEITFERAAVATPRFAASSPAFLAVFFADSLYRLLRHALGGLLGNGHGRILGHARAGPSRRFPHRGFKTVFDGPTRGLSRCAGGRRSDRVAGYLPGVTLATGQIANHREGRVFGCGEPDASKRFGGLPSRFSGHVRLRSRHPIAGHRYRRP
jgi:hypothetical protein